MPSVRSSICTVYIGMRLDDLSVVPRMVSPVLALPSKTETICSWSKLVLMSLLPRCFCRVVFPLPAISGNAIVEHRCANWPKPFLTSHAPRRNIMFIANDPFVGASSLHPSPNISVSVYLGIRRPRMNRMSFSRTEPLQSCDGSYTPLTP